ncbi:MAG: 23S rRNA pseudouridine(955/2504/2580) synthase RluC [Gammaproteobacteria bacterium]|nr:23S rRNA pseudouridine(955/2504/2580) synthase RluC [Gammaproteobacteria bacterium]MCW8839824.1 23S rRNA pseudouridine(955/2504/2580) synthase RluC [Gammaproteobacteria bacterium]MCW8928414.1 23S rRNA pseudouridine(955/2504/2580) synthase RluC [Gammaproteobacteria bacterium]MCW8958736.1 23S rRNA pseudouridine(955/2504/2580) synthase RluC [Gammaproteobacteria bacterium]MCW8973393.1 23S rRNA pseudouridine(955/2504/2580) synthase RluC [Gammaproteobacteria bacterium]
MNENPASRVREVTVGEESGGQRIDNFLLKHLKGVPKSRIYRILRKGEVRVNKGRIKPEYRLKIGDIVRIPPIRVSEKPAAANPGQRLQQLLEQSILYEDKALLVLNKPSGLAVHGGSGISFGVIEALRAMRPEAHFLELAHRLDRDTSGCLVIAKKRSALRAFQQLLRDDGMEKTYLALVKGRWEGGRRGVDAPLRKNTLRSGERIVTVSDDGKPSLSIFTPETLYRDCSLMRVKLVTGRTHQVRVHAQFTGHPIAADDKYGDAGFNRQMAQRGLRRLFLHARELRFTLPESTTIHVEAPLDDELRAVLNKLDSDQ